MNYMDKKFIASEHSVDRFILKILCKSNREQYMNIRRNVHKFEQTRRDLIKRVKEAKVYPIGHPIFNVLMDTGDVEFGKGIFPEYRYNGLAVYVLQVGIDNVVIKTVLAHDEVEKTVKYVKYS